MNFSEVSRLPADVKNAWLRATLKEIKNLINNQNFLMDDPCKGYLMPPCMDLYKEKLQSYGSLEKLNLGIVVRGDL